MTRYRFRHDPLKSLVAFVVGDVTYAVEITRVREVANPLPVVSLPKGSEAVSGVADYRGEVVPVIGLRERFGLPHFSDKRTKWLIVDVGGRYVALVVDRVTEVFGTMETELTAAPPLGGGEEVRGILGVTRKQGKMVFVLDAHSFGALTEPLIEAGMLSGVEFDSLPPGGGSS